MHFPQFLIVFIICLSTGFALANHGKPAKAPKPNETQDAFPILVVNMLFLGLLAWGGFFR